MRVLFKGISMVSNEPVQLECNIQSDRYSIRDYGKRVVITVNYNHFIAINKESFTIKVLNGDSNADL